MPTALTSAQRAELAAHHPGWVLHDETVARTIRFADFAGAVAFVVQVALLAEAMNHHPDIDIRWNEVKLSLSTHSIGALSDLDAAFVGAVDERL
jgi:4a-hydroxytetrahydrobiopterin dehydratase